MRDKFQETAKALKKELDAESYEVKQEDERITVELSLKDGEKMLTTSEIEKIHDLYPIFDEFESTYGKVLAHIDVSDI